MNVRFRSTYANAVMRVPRWLRETGALTTGATFLWPSLARALGERCCDYEVVAVGWEGTPAGSDLVIHVV